MSFMEGIHIGKDAKEWFFYQIRIMFVLSLDFIYCLPFKKNLIFKILNNWKLDFYLEINLEYAMCYHIIKTSFDSTFENHEFVCWFKNVVFWGYGISYGIPYFHMLLPKCT